MAKTFAALRNLPEAGTEDEVEISVKDSGVDSSLPSDSDQLDDADENTRNIDGNADSMEVTAVKPIYAKQDDGSYTLNTEEYVYEQHLIQENVLDDLKKIVARQQAATVKFQDGKSMKVDMQTAQALLTVQGALNKNNQVKMAGMLAKNKASFTKMVDFSWKQVGLSRAGGLQGPASGPLGGAR